MACFSLISLLRLCGFSAVKACRCSALVRATQGRREFPGSSVPASLHCPGGKHQPTNRPLRTFITQAPKQRLQTSRARMGPFFFLRGCFGPPSKKNHINKSILQWENEQCFAVFSLCDGLIFRELNEERMPSNDKAGWRGVCVCGGGVVEAD